MANTGGLVFSLPAAAGAAVVVGSHSLAVDEPVAARFSLRYLSIFAKSAPMSADVEMKLGPSSPLLLTFPVRGVESGFLQFHLGLVVE